MKIVNEDEELAISIDIDQIEDYVNEEGIVSEKTETPETPDKPIVDKEGKEILFEGEIEATPELVDTEGGEIDVETDANVYAAFVKSLQKKGILENLGEDTLEEINSEDDLAELFQEYIESKASNQFGSYKQNLISNLKQEGYIKPEKQESFLNYTEEQITQDDDLQENIVRALLEHKGVKGNLIDKIVSDSTTLREDAIEAYAEINEIKEKQEAQKQAEILAKEQAAKQQQEQNMNSLKETTYAVSEFIPGKAVTPKMKEKVFNNIMPTLEKINSNLTKYAPLLSYLDQYGLLEGDWSSVDKSFTTKATSKFESLLQRKRKNTGSYPAKGNKTESSIKDDLLASLNR